MTLTLTLTLAPTLSLLLDAITQTFDVLAVRGAGKSNLAAVMAEHMHAARLPFVVVRRAPGGACAQARTGSARGSGLRSSADATATSRGTRPAATLRQMQDHPDCGTYAADGFGADRLMKPLLVGESNPYSEKPQHALLPHPPGSAGARLLNMLGWPVRDYLWAFARANLMSFGDRWDATNARRAAAELLEGHDGEVVMLGARVAVAFRQGDLPLWETRGRFTRLPHPSGRSRAWNTPGARANLRRVMGRFLEGRSMTKEGE